MVKYLPSMTNSGQWSGFMQELSIILGRPSVKRFALRYQTVVCPVLSVGDVDVLWPNGWMDQDATTWYGDRPRARPHCVRWGPSPPKSAQFPQFSAHVCCGQTARCIKMPLRKEVGLSPSNIVLDGAKPLPPKGGGAQQAPTF